MSDEHWCEDFKEVSSSIGCAGRSLADLTRWLWDEVVAHDVWPREMPEPARTLLQSITSELERIDAITRALFTRLCSGPTGKLLTRQRLKEEEYHLLAALGIEFDGAKSLGLIELDDFEILSLLYYEDDSHRGYISPALTPRGANSARIPAPFCISPGNVSMDALRPEQREFFRQYLPEVYETFIPSRS